MPLELGLSMGLSSGLAGKSIGDEERGKDELVGNESCGKYLRKRHDFKKGGEGDRLSVGNEITERRWTTELLRAGGSGYGRWKGLTNWLG